MKDKFSEEAFVAYGKKGWAEKVKKYGKAAALNMVRTAAKKGVEKRQKDD